MEVDAAIQDERAENLISTQVLVAELWEGDEREPADGRCDQRYGARAPDAPTVDRRDQPSGQDVFSGLNS